MDFIELTHKKLDLNEINDLVAHESCGAVSYFVGTTRDNFDEKKVISLEYEAYDQMAVKAMKSICKDIRNKWPDIVNTAIYHRLGTVAVKEASVIIAVSSPHRNTSLEAVQFTIESLKKIVPIWKKEKYSQPEGSSEWKENKESKQKRCYPLESDGIESPMAKKRVLNRKLIKLSFEDCLVKTSLDDQANSDKKIVQITASENEIERRVNCFIERKREEIDLLNIQDFTIKNSNLHNTDENDENSYSSCARIDSVVFKMKNSKGHLRVQRVKNDVGPQVVDYINELDKLMTNKTVKKENLNNSDVPQGIDDRLTNVESVLDLQNPVSKNIYQRLKIIEDKLLYLESVSPEYFGIIEKEKKIPSHGTVKQEKISYSTTELDELLNKIKTKISSATT